MNEPHDLVAFFDFYSFKIQKEYEILSRRVREDPGTAGDQGEENWKELFECWLPDNYKVVTKGRILNLNGEATKQWDVIILKHNYPKALINYKHYISSGVYAVFECRITLRKQHIKEHIKRAQEFKMLLQTEDIKRIRSFVGTSTYGFNLTHSSIHTGLLAHTTKFIKKTKRRRKLSTKKLLIKMWK